MRNALADIITHIKTWPKVDQAFLVGLTLATVYVVGVVIRYIVTPVP